MSALRESSESLLSQEEIEASRQSLHIDKKACQKEAE